MGHPKRTPLQTPGFAMRRSAEENARMLVVRAAALAPSLSLVSVFVFRFLLIDARRVPLLRFGASAATKHGRVAPEASASLALTSRYTCGSLPVGRGREEERERGR